MDVTPLQGTVKATSIPFEELANNPGVSQKDKIKEACRQFEALLLRQVLTEARKTVIKSPEEQESNETQIYNDMVNNQLAESISSSGALGLSKSVESQLLRQDAAKGAPHPARPAAPTATVKHH